jgi:hypothetical protein
MPKSHAAVFVVAVRIHHPVWGRLGRLEILNALRHWKLWIHTSEGEDFFLHLHIIDNGEHISLQQDVGWDPKEKEFVSKHNSVLFLGVTRQSIEDIAKFATQIAGEWGGYEALTRNCQDFVLKIRPHITLLPEDKWTKLGEPTNSINATFPEMKGYKPATGQLRKLLSEEYALGPRGKPTAKGVVQSRVGVQAIQVGEDGGLRVEVMEMSDDVMIVEPFPSDEDILKMIHKEIWENDIVPLPKVPEMITSTATLTTLGDPSESVLSVRSF